jgi:uncharacterized LabA/DUF88 family protein
MRSGQIIGNMMKFRNHNQAVVYNRHANYNQILHAELSRKLIERLPNAQEENGESLVIGMRHLRENQSSTNKLLVAASSRVRDQVQLVLRDYVHQKAKMAVLEYQP